MRSCKRYVAVVNCFPESLLAGYHLLLLINSSDVKSDSNLRKGLYSNLVDHDVGPSHCIEFHGERSPEYFIPFLDREAVPLHCLKRSIVKIKSFLSRTQKRYPSTISSQNTSWALTPPMQENKIANSQCSFHIKFNMSNSAIVDVFVPLISSDLIKVSVVVQFLPLVQNFLNQFKLFF